MNRLAVDSATRGHLTRRAILRGWFLATAAGLNVFNDAGSQALAQTSSCGSDSPTLAGTEGPFFTPASPLKRNFRSDEAGDPLSLIGFVLDTRCRPVVGAVVDLWHADAHGEYDNAGYKLRGHQPTDAQGRYVFETIVPAPYGRRTRHYHVKVRPQGGQVLTTQLYFPGEERNDGDFLFDPRLLMRVENAADGKVAHFDFVLDA